MGFLPVTRKLFPFDDRARRLEHRDFTQFRGRRNPPSSLGSAGDVFINEREKNLHVRLNGSKGWSQPWDGSFKNRIPHPLYRNRYLWIVDSRLEYSSDSVIKLPKNQFFVKGEVSSSDVCLSYIVPTDFEKILSSVIQSSSTSKSELDLLSPVPSMIPSRKRKHSFVEFIEGELGSGPSNSTKRGRISIASPSPGGSSKDPSPRAPLPSETNFNTDHDLLNSILTRGSQGALPVSNDGAALAKMNVAESQVDVHCTERHSQPTSRFRPPVKAWPDPTVQDLSEPQITQECPQVSSYLGPARPTVRRSSTLSLPEVETLPEPEDDPNDDNTELWDEDVDELLSEEMVGCGLGRQSDEVNTGSDSHGSSTYTVNSFQKDSSHAKLRFRSHQMKTSTIISKSNKSLSPNMTARVSDQQEALEDRFQYFPASNSQNPVMIESDTDDIDEPKDVAELCLPMTTSRDKTASVSMDSLVLPRSCSPPRRITHAINMLMNSLDPISVQKEHRTRKMPSAIAKKSACADEQAIRTKPIIDLTPDDCDFNFQVVGTSSRSQNAGNSCISQPSLLASSDGSITCTSSMTGTGDSLQNAIDLDSYLDQHNTEQTAEDHCFQGKDGYESSSSDSIVNLSLQEYSASVKAFQSDRSRGYRAYNSLLNKKKPTASNPRMRENTAMPSSGKQTKPNSTVVLPSWNLAKLSMSPTKQSASIPITNRRDEGEIEIDGNLHGRYHFNPESVKKKDQKRKPTLGHAVNTDVFSKAPPTKSLPASNPGLCAERDLSPQRWHLRLLYRKDKHSPPSQPRVVCVSCDTDARNSRTQDLSLPTVVSFPQGRSYESDMIRHARDKHQESYIYTSVVRMSKEEVEMKMVELRARKGRANRQRS
ncbi:hypothetical protein F5050DRAFT_1780108 [Lentinula boryana]|uniref:Uncharacterized protein n=1 Tax=Lentinula boryana TaxID=40481 RepID=A0ABQ8Q4L2_9AGAR|nr:hypothetical protein F5050DRAFT_1780108 [Lentinula boryana]